MSRKYIIEIADEPYTNDDRPDALRLFKALAFKNIMFDQEDLNKMTPYDEDSAYAEGYTAAESKNLYNDSYDRGLDAAWVAARKICTNWCISDKVLTEIFGRGETIDNIMQKYTATEAIEKIREYEERTTHEDTEIKVGDVVKDADGIVAIVIRISKCQASLLVSMGDESGHIQYSQDKSTLTKTGRHINLTELFEQVTPIERIRH